MKEEELTDEEFDALHGGRELLPIEQAICEAEGAERFERFHGHGRRFPENAERWITTGKDGRNEQ